MPTAQILLLFIMENRTIRNDALAWFRSKFHIVSDEIYTSKFYTLQESWSYSRGWFFQIPLEVIISKNKPKWRSLFNGKDPDEATGELILYFGLPKTLFNQTL